MITEIPTAAEFQDAASNQLYLAWQIAMRAIQDYEEVQQLAEDLELEDAATAASAYWSKSQPVLANAFGLIQQAMEMALKGRIAAVSPYLLIARDPKEWPGGADRRAVPFSEFRTLDAADLMKVHNTFADPPLDDAFQAFWNGVRRDRNKLMHSVSAITVDPMLLIRGILTAVEALASEIPWPQRLLAMQAEGKYAAYGIGADEDQNIVMGQIDTAVRHLTPADNRRFFGFDPKRRAYTCPECWDRANRDWQEDWPALAQLGSKEPGETSLGCIVCGNVTTVERADCTNSDCKGDVIYDGKCLTCMAERDSPWNFRSGLENASLSLTQEYRLLFKRDVETATVTRRFSDDTSAIEHARRAMNAPFLREWRSVTLDPDRSMSSSSTLGTWTRQASTLVWEPVSRDT